VPVGVVGSLFTGVGTAALTAAARASVATRSSDWEHAQAPRQNPAHPDKNHFLDCTEQFLTFMVFPFLLLRFERKSNPPGPRRRHDMEVAFSQDLYAQLRRPFPIFMRVRTSPQCDCSRAKY